MLPIKIRHVTEHDLDDCYAIESVCYTSDAATREKIQKRIQVFPEGFLVAESNGHIMGMINSGSTNKEDITDEAFKDMVGHVRDGKNIVIFSLAVLPEFQGSGVSKKLMSKFIGASKDMKKEKILLICKADFISYYQKYGFLYGGKSKSTHGGFEWHEMYLSLNVD
ncbi:MAG: GNAT family N-acetyltransferase [Candidatus Brocadia sp. WS118]|nr:MAG: GNAT family N-acetyltransferase [Candidatus Brocadia sp. WS118]